jgi:hypothetical protein
MSDPSFEMRLQRMFAEHPHYPDAPLFAADVENRLGRAWALRRMLIGAAGVAGGLIAIVQFAGARFGQRISEIWGAAMNTGQSLHSAATQLPLPFSEISQLPYGSEALWMVAGLAVLAGALFASRSIQEI